MKIITYSSENAESHEKWLAYLVINDQQWLVRFTGHSELEAITKANCFWVKEQDKQKALDRSCPQNVVTGAQVKNLDDQIKTVARRITEDRGAHFMGTIWMVNKSTGHKVRIVEDRQAEYEANGYQRGGPRTPYKYILSR